MDEQDLGTQLRRYAAPVPPAPGARERVVERVGRRRRRRRAVAVAAVVLAVTGTAVTADVLSGDGRRGVAPADVVGDQEWRALPAGPLSPRYGAVGAWTGEELVVVGGTTGFVCPPNADCSPPERDTWRADGAAYDPATGGWRNIPDAPRAFHHGLAIWTGEEVVVTAGRAAFAYDPDTDRWRDLDPVPGTFDRAVRTDAGVAFSSYDQPARGDGVSDWLLDPAGTWTPLPHDPFAESYDRSLAWDGARLWLLSMSVEGHGGAHEGSPSRLAVLEPGPGGLADGTWRVVTEETPELTYEQDLFWDGSRLVVPPSTYGGPGRVAYDPATGTWSSWDGPERRPGGVRDGGTDSDPDDCLLPGAGTGPTYVAGGGAWLVPHGQDVVRRLPGCPSLAVPDVAVWAGETLLVWGGTGRDWEEPVAVGLAWRPS